MGIDRREFLVKAAGLSTIIGLGGTSAFQLLKPGELEASETAAKAQGHGEGDSATTKPLGIRYGMVIDMSKNEDWQACIDACHREHNVPKVGNPKEEIKWIWTETYEHTFPTQNPEFVREEFEKIPFLVLCNHCDQPACVRVCPTKATYKQADGIVNMDMHRCIGCRFCMAGCPFGARSFNWREPRTYFKGKEGEMNPKYPTRERGVVEKCNFCAERAPFKEKLPACVEKCKNGGIVFGDLNDTNSEIRRILRTKSTIRRAPEAGTFPSVFYVV